MPEMIGIVLCGGQSTRMGSDKGLMKKGEYTWAEIAFHKLSALSLPVVVSINEGQSFFYKNVFPENNLLVDDINVSGPLKGILTVHKKFPSKNIMVLAADMVDMDIEVLEYLYKEYKERHDEYDFFIYESENGQEPLCAIYSSRALSNILSIYYSENLKKYSMKYALSLGEVFSIALPEKFKGSFTNYNEIAQIPH